MKNNIKSFLFFVFIFGLVSLNGCQTFNKGSHETAVDTELSRPGPSLPPPSTEPAEPQKGFEQEPPRSQELT